MRGEISVSHEELPCCNPNVNRTVQNIWCVPSVFCYLLFLQPMTIPFGVPGVAQSGAVYSVRQFRKCVWKSMDCTAKSSFPGLVPRKPLREQRRQKWKGPARMAQARRGHKTCPFPTSHKSALLKPGWLLLKSYETPKAERIPCAALQKACLLILSISDIAMASQISGAH